MIKLNVFLILIMIALSCCRSKSEGLFFGNGVHNGWADQSSVVIWTRLIPELMIRIITAAGAAAGLNELQLYTKLTLHATITGD